MPPGQQAAQAGGVAGQGVVAGYGDDYGPLVAQVGLAGQGHSGVGNAAGQLCQGVAGAGGDNQQIQQLFGADGLRLGDAGDGPGAADLLRLGDKVRRLAEAAVDAAGRLGENGEDVLVLPAQRPQGLQGCLKGTEGSAQGVS